MRKVILRLGLPLSVIGVVAWKVDMACTVQQLWQYLDFKVVGDLQWGVIVAVQGHRPRNREH